MASDEFLSISENQRVETKVEGSRFIAESFGLNSREQAQEATDAIRKREHRATHHCSAYRIGEDKNTFYYDDDGEPSGTAGQPILRQIDGRDLTNVLVVVTRYYGGVKLGTGGLVRAYGDAASRVLDESGVTTHVRRRPVSITFGYEDTAAVEQLLDRFDVEKRDAEYTDVTRLHLGIRTSNVEKFVTAFTNQLGRRGTAKLPDEGG